MVTNVNINLMRAWRGHIISQLEVYKCRNSSTAHVSSGKISSTGSDHNKGECRKLCHHMYVQLYSLSKHTCMITSHVP